MKKLTVFLFVAAVLLFSSSLFAKEATLGLCTGYAWSDHGYIDDAASVSTSAINQNGFTMGMELWYGGKIQWGFVMGIVNPYRDTNSGDGVALNFYTFKLMFGFRLRIIGGFFFGGATGYHLALKAPSDRIYGDDGIVAMALTGYDFKMTNRIVFSPGFRVLWGFEKSHVFTSYMPVLSIAYRF